MPSLNTKLASAPNTTSNYVLKATSSTTIGNSLIFDNGTNVGIGTASPTSIASGYTSLTTNGTNGSGLVMQVNGTATGYLYAESGSLNITNTSGSMIFYNGGAERMRISSTGMIGVGTSPSSWDTNTFRGLQITGGSTQSNAFLVGRTDGVFDQFQLGVNAYFDGSNWKYINSAASSRYYQNAGGHIFDGASSGTAGGNITFIERGRISSNGYTRFSNNGTYLNSSGTYHEFNQSANDSILEMTNRGNSPYGIVVRYANATPNGGTNEFLYCVDATNAKFFVVSSGTAYNRTGTYGAISDRKYKENIIDATPKLDDLLKLKVRNFNMIGEDTKQLGFIAQEFEEVFPAMVETNIEKETNEEFKAIKTSVLIPMLVKAIQEQQAMIEAQQQQINQLINK